MNESKDPGIRAAHDLLHLADEQMKKGNYEGALTYVRKVYDTDPKNMYARAYEERVLMAKVEKKVHKESEALLSIRMRDFISGQEKKTASVKDGKSIEQKQDPVLREIHQSLETAKERLYGVILSRAASPEETAKQAKEMVASLVEELKQRHEKIRTLMLDHEANILASREEEHKAQTRKLYRSLVYMMQKLGVRFEHRNPLLQLVSFYAHFTDEETKALTHNAALGIYEDLLKHVYIQGEPSEENVQNLEKTRTHFGISSMEHEMLVAHAKNELLLSEHIPAIAIVDNSPKVGEYVMSAVRSEFPKTKVQFFSTPEDFLKHAEKDLPDVLLCGALFDTGGLQGMDLCKKLKDAAHTAEKQTDFVVMLEVTDEFFKQAVEQLGLGKILQKPFSKELLMWTLRPLIFKASGAPVA
jgi:hypothetical protein